LNNRSKSTYSGTNGMSCVQTHGEGNKVTTITKVWALTLFLSGGVWTLEGCTPRVEVVPSDKPITINLNVKIDHEIRIKIEKELQEVLSEKTGLF